VSIAKPSQMAEAAKFRPGGQITERLSGIFEQFVGDLLRRMPGRIDLLPVPGEETAGADFAFAFIISPGDEARADKITSELEMRYLDEYDVNFFVVPWPERG
jgi:hypothetical protein